MANKAPLIDAHGRPYRLLRARDILTGDEILTDRPGTGMRVEAVETDQLGQVRHRFGNDTACSSYIPQEFLRVAETPGLAEWVQQGWRRYAQELEQQYPDGPPFVQISEEDFDEKFRPIQRPGDDNAAPLYEYHEVKDQQLEHVWSIIEGEDGGWYAQPGFHVVNMMGYTLTEIPWEHDNMEAVYFEATADEDDLQEGGMRP